MMNNSLHVFLCVCIVASNYLLIAFGKGDMSMAWYTNLAVLVNLGLVQMTDGLSSIWKK